MIPYQTLEYLVSNKIKDARVLLKNRRFPATIYLSGYAVELALKQKICRTMQFSMGFPETKQEFQNYLIQINKNNAQPLTIVLHDIRNHDLNKLLIYSGPDLRIKSLLFSEWEIVKRRNPENRYRKLRIMSGTAEAFFKATRKIIQEIN